MFAPSHFEEYLEEAKQDLDNLIYEKYREFTEEFTQMNMEIPREEREFRKTPTREDWLNGKADKEIQAVLSYSQE